MRRLEVRKRLFCVRRAGRWSALPAGASLLCAMIAGVLIAHGQANSYSGYKQPIYSSPIAILVANPAENNVSSFEPIPRR